MACFGQGNVSIRNMGHFLVKAAIWSRVFSQPLTNNFHEWEGNLGFYKPLRFRGCVLPRETTYSISGAPHMCAS